MKEECWHKWRGRLRQRGRTDRRPGPTTTWISGSRSSTPSRRPHVRHQRPDPLPTRRLRQPRARRRRELLKNGTVVILTTIPPRSGVRGEGEDVRRGGAEDRRRPEAAAHRLPGRNPEAPPDDWDGQLPKFKEFAKDVYQDPHSSPGTAFTQEPEEVSRITRMNRSNRTAICCAMC